MSKPKIICIVGPTGSGKTALGVLLAKKFDGEIVSADSRQIYRGLDISSGKDGWPMAKIKNQKSKISEPWCIEDIPQWLISIMEPGERFTLFDWLKLAKEKIADILSRGKLPIVVGGTMLYISALVEGFQLAPRNFQFSNINFQSISNDQMSKIKKKKIYTREQLDNKTLAELQEICLRLRTYDLELDLNNPHRLIRAIEKAQVGEKPVKSESDYDSLVLAYDIPREELYQRIDKRVDERFNAGMMQEIKNLLLNQKSNIKYQKHKLETAKYQCHPELVEGSSEANFNIKMASWLLGLGLDFRVITQYLLDNGLNAPTSGVNYDEMVQRFKFAEHNYARRQLIWWRRKEVVWVGDAKEAVSKTNLFLG